MTEGTIIETLEMPREEQRYQARFRQALCKEVVELNGKHYRITAFEMDFLEQIVAIVADEVPS